MRRRNTPVQRTPAGGMCGSALTASRSGSKPSHVTGSQRSVPSPGTGNAELESPPVEACPVQHQHGRASPEDRRNTRHVGGQRRRAAPVSFILINVAVSCATSVSIAVGPPHPSAAAALR